MYFVDYFMFFNDCCSMVVFWFRRDLRVEDNVGFYNSLISGASVLPIFIFDEDILSQLEKNDARVTFIFKQLEKIQSVLSSYNKSLAVFKGNPKDVFEKIVSENSIDAVYTNHDYEPYAVKRDEQIGELLSNNNIKFHTFKDQVIFEKSEILKPDGTPYIVFTPYSKRWKEFLSKTTIGYCNSEQFLENIATHNYPFLSLNAIGFTESKIEFPMVNLSQDTLLNYHNTRNIPSLQNGTSLLSTHLRFGAVSIRIIVNKVKNTNETFLNELIWREFFMQILWHFPYTVHNSFKPKYDAIQWQNNEDHFKHWCNGTTGYPIVDAGMRELNTTGLMHNRVRMIVASFLCKHLLIDWRWGEAYFANKLLDYEQSSNVGNWQWAAGSGVDAAPYFRIFNPTEQQKKFDSKLDYINKWIPELNSLDYPSPIVEHQQARKRCLEVYKKAVSI